LTTTCEYNVLQKRKRSVLISSTDLWYRRSLIPILLDPKLTLTQVAVKYLETIIVSFPGTPITCTVFSGKNPRLVCKGFNVGEYRLSTIPTKCRFLPAVRPTLTLHYRRRNPYLASEATVKQGGQSGAQPVSKRRPQRKALAMRHL
jgi:hypothetical protein